MGTACMLVGFFHLSSQINSNSTTIASILIILVAFRFTLSESFATYVSHLYFNSLNNSRLEMVLLNIDFLLATAWY